MIPLTLACAEYDRTRPLIDGRVRIEGCAAEIHCLDFEDMFVRALTTAEFDATELSFSRFVLNVAAGTTPYVALPIFLSRTFRHSAIYVRSDRGIARPEDLRGKRVGVRDYANTASLVARGMLEDEYGLRAQDVQWIVGDVDHAERREIRLPRLPEGFDVRPAPPGGLLSDMLLEGAIDGLIDYQPPRCFGAAGGVVVRLFADHVKAEQDYFRRTRIFPIMHALVLKRSIAARADGLAERLYRAFLDAKEIAVANLCSPGALRITLPWVTDEHARTVSAMGADFWPYGIAANRNAIESILRYVHAQGLAARQLTIEELFVPELLTT